MSKKDTPREEAGPIDEVEDRAGEVTKRLAGAITEARLEAGITQSELAHRVGVDQSVVSTWVRGRSMPTLERIVALDEAMGLRPGTLLERAGIIQRPSVDEAVEHDPELDEEARQAVNAAYYSGRVQTAQRRLASIEEELQQAHEAAEYYETAVRAAESLGEPDRAKHAKATLTKVRREANLLDMRREEAARKLVDLMTREPDFPISNLQTFRANPPTPILATSLLANRAKLDPLGEAIRKAMDQGEGIPPVSVLGQRAFGRRSAESGAGVEARIDRLEGLIEKLLDHIERGDE